MMKKISKPNLLNIYPRIMGNPSQRKIVNNSKERDEYIKKFISPLKQILEKQNLTCDIKGRPKSIFSIAFSNQGIDSSSLPWKA